jgi:hypothetical protein
MSGTEVARAMRARDSAALTHLLTAEVAEFLVALAGQEEMAYPGGDLDSLMTVAAMTSAAGHRDADDALLQWLGEAPSPARLRVASTVLGVMWNPAEQRPPVEGEKVRRLLRAGRSLPASSDVQGPYLYALGSGALASRDPTTMRAASDELRAAASRDQQLGAALRGLIGLLDHRSDGGLGRALELDS